MILLLQKQAAIAPLVAWFGCILLTVSLLMLSKLILKCKCSEQVFIFFPSKLTQVDVSIVYFWDCCVYLSICKSVIRSVVKIKMAFFKEWSGFFGFALTCVGNLLIARWILNEEDVDEQNTLLELDNIAQMVQDSLRGNKSSTIDALTSLPEEKVARGYEQFPVITHPTACLRILDCLKHVLYQQLQFKGNVHEYYKKENSMLHKVKFL